MRKTLLSILAMVLFTVLPMKAGIPYYLGPVDFEDGNLPAGWTQVNDLGTIAWAVEGGEGVSLSNPTGAKSGNYRVSAVGDNEHVEGFQTKLVTPAINLTAATNPHLVFSYANAARGSYNDTLKVFYRTMASAEWQLLKSYTTAHPAWTTDSLALPNYQSATAYQVAYEISGAGQGYGVSLDKIYVTQPSLCQDVALQLTTWSDSVFIELAGTGQFDLILSKKALKPDTISASDYTVHNGAALMYEYGDLDNYTTYYVYARSTCDDNASGYTNWVSSQFKTKMLVHLPFAENFSTIETASSYTYYGLPAGWAWGNDFKVNNVPCAYKGSSYSSKTTFSGYSVDSTAYLIMGGGQSTSTTIDANKKAYVATPEVIESLEGCEVSFWATANSYINSTSYDYAAELTVGVMSDPADMATFVPVKTVKMDYAYQFKRFDVRLSGVPAGAKHVVLMSQAAKKNIIYVDNLSVKQVANPTATDVFVSNILPTGFKVAANLNGATSWNLKVAKVYNRNPELIAAADVLFEQSNISATDYTVNLASLAGQTVCVYVQAAGGAWSFPVTLRVPTERVAPYTLTFNDRKEVPLKSLGNEIQSQTATKGAADLFFPLRSYLLYPEVSSLTASPKYDSAHVTLTNVDNYFALPYLASFDSLEVMFRLSAGSYSGQSRVAVGVMTNPYDLSTFDSIGVFEGTATTYLKCEQELHGYAGSGHYVAFRAIKSAGSGTYNYLDNITIQKIPTCREPQKIQTKAGVTTATITFDGKNMQQWLLSYTKDTVWKDTVVTSETIALSGLSQQTEYTFTLRTLCGGDTLAAEGKYTFTTGVGLPFKPKFTSTTLPSNWLKASVLASKVFGGTALTTTTSNSWYLTSSATGLTVNGYAFRINNYGSDKKDWVLTPEISLVENVGEQIELTFDAAMTTYSNRNAGTDDQFMVVISTDGGKTFKKADATIWNNDGTGDYVYNDLPEKSWHTYTIDLSKYAGGSIVIGFYAESTVTNADNYVLVQNIVAKVLNNDCLGLTKVTPVDITDNSAKINWTAGGTLQEVYLKVTTDSTVVFAGTTTDNPYQLTGLKGNKLYKVIAYQACMPSDTTTLSFRTECSPATIDELGVITFEKTSEAMLCWKTGLDSTGSGMSAGYYSSYLPKATTISNFGEVLQINKQKNYTSGSYKYNYGNKYYAVMPTLAIDSIKKYQVVFDAATTMALSDTANIHQLIVGVMTDNEDFSTFVGVDTVKLKYAAKTADMKTYALGFDGYDGDDYGEYGTYVVFYVEAPYGYYSEAIIDNVRLEPVNGCHQVIDLEVAHVAAESAVLTWSSKKATQFELAISDTLCKAFDSIPSARVTRKILNATRDSLTGLTPNSNYYAYVRAICGEGDTAIWSSATAFSTPCLLSAFPTTYTFENVSSAWTVSGSYKMPECWTTVYDGSSYPYLKTNSSDYYTYDYAHNGTSALYFYTYSGNASYAVMPELEADLDTLQVTFYGRPAYIYSYSSSSKYYTGGAESYARTIEVGVLTNPADTSTFQLLDRIVADAISGTTDSEGTNFWRKYSVSLRGAKGKCVAFRSATDKYNYFFIDDVTIEKGVACPNPKMYSSETLSAWSAKASWEGFSESYKLDLMVGSSLVKSLVVSEDSIVLTGLNPATSYTLRLQGICGADSTAVLTTSFKTGYGTPFSEDFNASTSTPSGWSTYPSSYSSMSVTSSSGAGLTTNHLYGASYHYYYSSSYSSYTSDYLYNYSLMTPEIEVENTAGNTVQLTFDAALTTQSTNTTAPDSANAAGHTFEVIVLTKSKSGWAKDSAIVWGDASAAYTYRSLPAKAANYTLDLTKYAGQSIKVAFFHDVDSTANKQSSCSTYVHVDNVVLKSVDMSCENPKDLTPSLATPSGATMRWSGDASATYVLQVSSDNKFAALLLNDTVVADTSKVISGLKAKTTYYARVATLCKSGLSEFASCTLKTAYEMPYTESFSSSLPSDWKRLTGDMAKGIAKDTTAGWYTTSSTCAGMDTYHLYCGVGKTPKGPANLSVALPRVAISAADGKSPVVSFKAALTASISGTTAPTAANCKGHTFGVAVSADDGKTWTLDSAYAWRDTISAYRFAELPAKEAEEYYLDLTPYIGQTIQLALFHGTDTTSTTTAVYVSVDDLKIEHVNLNCMAPKLTLGKTTADTARVVWKAEAGKTYLAQLSKTADFKKVIDSLTVADSMAVFVDSIKQVTTYYVRVKALCGADEESAWSETIVFTTPCGIYTLPFAEDFSSVSSSNPVPECWDNSENYKSSYSYSTYQWTYSTVGATGNGVFYNGSSSSTYAAYLATPTIRLNAASLLTFNLKNANSTKMSILISVDGKARKEIANGFANVSSWTAQEVDLSEYAGHDVVIYFKGSQNYIYLDDVKVTAIPATQTLKSVSAGNVTRTEADIQWVRRDTTACKNYELVLAKSLLTDSLLEKAAKTEVTDTMGYHAMYLDRETQYFVYVRTNCAGEKGDWVLDSLTTSGLYVCDIEHQYGDSTGTAYLIYSSYGNTYSQHIFTAAELKAQGLTAGPIGAIAFQYSGSSSTYDKEQSIYMGKANKTAFAGYSTSTDFISGLTKVYGPVKRKYVNGWVTYEFDQTYMWDGTSNIVVGVLTNYDGVSGSGTSSGWSTNGKTVSEKRTVYIYRDSSPFDVASLPSSTSGSTSNMRPNMRFYSCYLQEACPTVDTAYVELLGAGIAEAKISWPEAGGDYAGAYEVYVSGVDTLHADSIKPQYTNIDSLSVVVKGLEADSLYYVYVRNICDAAGKDEGHSTWFKTSFRTNPNCPAVQNLKATLTGKNSAKFSWNTIYEEQEKSFYYVLSTTSLSKAELALATYEQLEDTTAFSLDTLALERTYHLYVASHCGGAHSLWDSVSFTMPVSCPAVTNLHVADSAFNAVTLSWQRGQFGEETSWEVGLVGYPQQTQVVTDTTLLLFGLTAETQYTAYVKALCSAEDTSAVATLVFRTTKQPANETQLGDGTISTNLVMTNWGNTYSQHIYTAEELRALGCDGGQILSVAFQYKGTSSSIDKIQSVYIGTTSKSSFAGYTASDLVSGLQLVYGPTKRKYAAGWQTYDFTQAFTWDGVSNIVVGVLTNYDGVNGSGSSNGWDAAGQLAAETRTVYIYRDNSAIDVTNLSAVTYGYYSSNRPNIRFGFEDVLCAGVKRLQAYDVKTDSVKVSWYPGGSEMMWQTVLCDSALNDSLLAIAKKDTAVALTKQLTNLNVDADYYFYIRPICSSTETGEWKCLHFTTEAVCKAPVKLHAVSLTDLTATVAWTNISEGTPAKYIVAYAPDSVFSIDSVAKYPTVEATDTFALITGLTGNTTYQAVVREQCDDATGSRWSAPVVFTTECSVISTFPWKEDFEGYESEFDDKCWLNVHTAGYSSYVWGLTTSYGENSSKGLYMGYQSAGNKVMLVLPEMNIPEANAYEFSLSYSRGSYYSSYEGEGVEVYVSASDTLDASAQKLAFIPYAYSTVGTNVPAENATGWYNYQFTLPKSGNCHVILQYIWKNGYSAYVDNMQVRALPDCKNVKNLRAYPKAKEATLVCDNSGAANYRFLVTSKAIGTDTLAKVDSAIIVRDTLAASDSVLVRGLATGTTYYFYVQGVCSDEDSSAWSAGKSFTTDYLYALPYTEDFDDTSGPLGWSKTVGDIYSNAQKSTTYNWVASTSKEAGFDTRHLYSYVCNYYDYDYDYDYDYTYKYTDKYAYTTPMIDMTAPEDFGINMSFDMSLVDEDDDAPSYTSGRSFSVVISQDGGLTWNEADAFVWGENGNQGTYASIPSTPMTYTLDLSAYAGKQIKVAFLHDGSNVTYSSYTDNTSYVMIDNLSIATFNKNCQGVADVKVSNVTLSGADLNFRYKSGATNAVVELASDAVYETLIASDTIKNDSTYHITGVKESTTYYVRVKQLCGDDNESGYSQATFTTPKGVPFVPDFTEAVQAAEWNKSYLLMTDTILPDSLFTPYSYSGWYLTAADTVINARHYRAEVYGTTFKYWVKSPVIDLTPNVGEGMMLSVDLGLTPYGSYYRSSRNTGTDDRFAIVISEDGGKTWDITKNATIWDNDSARNASGATYSYNAVPEHAKTYRIDMSKYAGKQVQIGFYGESTQSNADNYFHFGNIRLTKVGNTVVIRDTICEGTYYQNYGFVVDADNQVPGMVNSFSNFTEGDSTRLDSLTVLNLYVLPKLEETDIYDAICEGEEYHKDGFNLLTPATRDYRQYFTNAAGCDSLVILHLTVNKIEHNDTTILVCKTEGYTDPVSGKTYYSDHIFVDTLTASTGCDSIVRRIVKVSAEEKITYVLRTSICEGQTYESDLFSGLSVAGTYTADTTSIYGCDSTVVLHLLVANDTAIFDTIMVEDLPYIYEGDSYLSENTRPGDYHHFVQVGSCGQRTLYIHVVDATGLFDPFAETEKAEKFLYQDKVYIRFRGAIYNSLGQRVTLDE